jgi:hypothetical protein
MPRTFRREQVNRQADKSRIMQLRLGVIPLQLPGLPTRRSRLRPAGRGAESRGGLPKVGHAPGGASPALFCPLRRRRGRRRNTPGLRQGTGQTAPEPWERRGQQPGQATRYRWGISSGPGQGPGAGGAGSRAAAGRWGCAQYLGRRLYLVAQMVSYGQEIGESFLVRRNEYANAAAYRF